MIVGVVITLKFAVFVLVMTYFSWCSSRLRQLEAGILPEEQDEDEATEIVNDPMVVDSEEFDSAVARLQAMYEQDLEEAEMHRIEKKKRKRINSAEDNEEGLFFIL